MNILMLGATGFVGTWVTHLLLAEDCHVKCAGRDVNKIKRLFPEASVQYCDFINNVAFTDWLSLLTDVDVIINCVGIFHHAQKNVLWNIHFNAPKALYTAAQQSGVKKIIHISALGVDEYANDYAHSKRAIETFLNTLTVPHVILRPSFIYGFGASGGMGLLKKLAIFPMVLPMPGNGMQLFQPIHVEDLAKAIKQLAMHPVEHTALTLAAVPMEKITLKQMLLSIRQWMKLRTFLIFKIPFPLIQLSARLGDLLSFSLLNTDAVTMLKHGNVTTLEEAAIFQKITHVRPLSFEKGLYKDMVTQKERWYLKLKFIHPLLRISLALTWIISAITSILPFSKAHSYNLLQMINIPTIGQPLILYGAAFLNAAIGFSLLFNYKIKTNCLIQIGLIFLYSLIITLQLPYLWLEPFGPIAKNVPILISIRILYILES